MTEYQARRIAVLGDTHDDAVGRESSIETLRPFLVDVDLILHTGDVTTEAMLDDLEAFAPVLAVRSEADPDLPPRLVHGPRALTVGPVRIELQRILEGEPVPRDDVDVVVHGGTHAPSIAVAGRTLYVNPGSPVFTDLPSIAFMELSAGRLRASIELLPSKE
jgi:uncharacterized protein